MVVWLKTVMYVHDLIHIMLILGCIRLISVELLEYVSNGELLTYPTSSVTVRQRKEGGDDFSKFSMNKNS